MDVETNDSKAGMDSEGCWVKSNGSSVKSDVYRVKSDARADSMPETKGARATAAVWVERCGKHEEHVGACLYRCQCSYRLETAYACEETASEGEMRCCP